MTDRQKALQVAAEVLQNPDNHPQEIVQVAGMLLVEPGSDVLAGEFLDLYGNADTALRLAGEVDLGWPPSIGQYLESRELRKPGAHLGEEPLRGWDLKLLPTDLERHLIVPGATGTGKTNCLRHITRGLGKLNLMGAHRSSIVVIDRFNNFGGLQELPRQDWLVLDARDCRFELLPEDIARQLLTAMGEIRSLIKSLNTVFEAHERVRSALKQMPQAPNTPTLSHLIQAVKTLDIEDTKRDWVLSCLSELQDLRRSVGVIWDHGKSDMIERLQGRGQQTVIRTGKLDLREELHLHVHLLLNFIRSGTIAARSHPIYVFVDELQHIWRRKWKDSNMLRTLKSALLTARQPKVRLIGGLQMPSQAEPELLASAGTITTTGLQDSDNIKEVAGAVGIPHGPAHDIFQDLQIGQAIHFQADRPGPFKIQVPLARLPDHCRDDVRKRNVKRFRDSCEIRTGPPWKDIYSVICSEPRSEEMPRQTSVTLLRAAAETYLDPLPLNDLASRVGMGGPEASRRARWLEKHGYADSEKVSIGRRRLHLIQPTQKGFDFLGKSSPSEAGRGGLGHRYCVSRVEDALEAKNYRVTREQEIRGKRIDVVAARSGKKLFAEIEMTAQNAARNAAADLKVGGQNLQVVWVACPTKKVLKTVKKNVRAAVDAQDISMFRFVAISDL